MRERERRGFIGEKENEERRKRRIEQWKEQTTLRKTQEGLSPPLRTMPGSVGANFVKDRVPLGSFDMGAKILIETSAGAAVMAADFQRFSHF